MNVRRHILDIMVRQLERESGMGYRGLHGLNEEEFAEAASQCPMSEGDIQVELERREAWSLWRKVRHFLWYGWW